MKVLSTLSGLLLLLGSVSFTSCGDAGNTSDTATDGTGQNADSSAQSRAVAEATITGTLVDSVVRGTARFEEQEGGKIRLQLQVMVPSKANSTVAIHIHQNGSCGDTANQAGPHWSPANSQHGHVDQGSNVHPGDFGNVKINADGRGEYSFTSEHWTIGGDSTTNILDRAIVVHGGVDDLKTQPSGNSGPRIGCGIIRRSTGTTP